jgi:hypothetical protein
MTAVIIIGSVMFYVTGIVITGNRLHWRWWVTASKYRNSAGTLRTSKYSSENDCISYIIPSAVTWGFWLVPWILALFMFWHPRHEVQVATEARKKENAAKVIALQRSELGRDEKGDLLQNDRR